MTHLTVAGPLGHLDHMDVPLGLGSSLWEYDTIGGSTSDCNCCQIRNTNYDYIITTTLSRQNTNTNTKFLLTSATCPSQLTFWPPAIDAFFALVVAGLLPPG